MGKWFCLIWTVKSHILLCSLLYVRFCLDWLLGQRTSSPPGAVHSTPRNPITYCRWPQVRSGESGLEKLHWAMRLLLHATEIFSPLEGLACFPWVWRARGRLSQPAEASKQKPRLVPTKRFLPADPVPHHPVNSLWNNRERTKWQNALMLLMAACRETQSFTNLSQ